MADKDIVALTAATTPLTGAELVKVIQGGNSRKVAVTDVVAVSTGAMLKATYDPNDDGIIAVAQGGSGAATAAAARTNYGLGTMAVQNAATVAITGGSVTGITDITVADGGTGASTASGARTNLELEYGVDVQPWSANLDGFAATTVANVQNRVNHTGTQLAATISDFSTAADARVSAAIGSTVQAYSANLDSWSAILPASKLDASVIPAAEDGKILSWTGTSLVNKTAGELGTLVVGQDVQAYSANLETLAGITPGQFGQDVLAAADADAAGVLLNASTIYITRKRINQVTHGEDVGILTSNTETQNAAAIEQAQADILGELGGGELRLGHGSFQVGSCPSGETIELGNNPTAASDAAIVVKPGITLAGAGMYGGTKIIPATGLHGFLMLSASGQTMRDMEFDGGWTSGASTGSGFFNAVTSDVGRTNLVAPGTFDSTTESWAASGNIALSSVSGRLRLTYNPTVTSGRMQKGFVTEIGRTYRLRAAIYRGTVPTGRIRVHFSSSASLAGIFFTQKPTIKEDFADLNAVMSFTAISTTTYIMLDTDGDQPSLANAYFEIDNIVICDFPVEEQAAWFRDTVLERLYVHNFLGYGGGIEDGDIINATIRNCHVDYVGYDGIDTKQRGPSRKNVNLILQGNLIERFCLFADTTTSRGAQAGIDLHGVGTVIGNTVRDFGRAGHEVHGIRMRTGGPIGIPYEGEQASRSMVIGNILEGNGEGTTVAIPVGSPYCEVIGGSIKGVTDGVVFGGNLNLDVKRGAVSHVVVQAPARYGIWLTNEGNTAAHCTVEDAGTYGFYNTGTNSGFIGNVYGGTGTAHFADATPALTERSAANTWA